MQGFPRSVRVYIAAIVLGAIATTAVAIARIEVSTSNLVQVLLFAGVICLADLYPIVLPFENNAEITVSCAVKTAAAILFGPAATIVATFLGTLLAELLLRRTWYKTLFNTAEMTLTFAVASIAYEWAYDGARMPFHSAQNAYAVLLIMVTYFVVNTGLVTGIVALTSGVSYWRLWRVNFRDITWDNLTIIPLGAVMATMYQYQWWSTVTLILPLVVVRQSLQFIGELQQQTGDALISMADSIDARDPNTYQHSQRVSTISVALARELGLSDDDVEVVRMAGRLHDIGKIGMSNSLLLKPGAFTTEEREQFQEHSRLGANLVKSFRMFAEGQDLILYHHENIDGTGYPTRIAGDAIPLGSRILRVADAFDAMTSRRVYKDPMKVQDALDELVRCSGTQFDGDVVAAMLRVWETAWGETLPWGDAHLAPAVGQGTA